MKNKKTIDNKPITREIIIKLQFNWDDYSDVCDELMLEDGLSLKEGIEYEILPPVKK